MELFQRLVPGRSAASVCRQVSGGGVSNGTRKPDTPHEQTLSSMVHNQEHGNKNNRAQQRQGWDDDSDTNTNSNPEEMRD